MYNSAPFIERALLSAITAGANSGYPFDIWIVDNNSTDNSVEVVQRVAIKYDAALQIVRCDESGAGAARNYGVRHSSGSWLQFLDADDTLEPTKLEQQIGLSGEAEWIIAGYQDVRQGVLSEINLPNRDPWKGLTFGSGIGHTGSNLYRRELFNRVGGYDTSLTTAEDLDLYRRLLASGAPYAIDNAVRSYYYHHTYDRLTSGDQKASMFRRIEVFHRGIEYLKAAEEKYWLAEKAYFIQAMLMSFRYLATYDLQRANHWYQKYGSDLHSLDYTCEHIFLPTYTRLYPYLGFRNVEALRLLLARVLPEGLKARLKG